MNMHMNMHVHVVLVALLFLAGVFGIFTYAVDRGHSLALAQTMAMNTLVVLDHQDAIVTQIYAEHDFKRAEELMTMSG